MIQETYAEIFPGCCASAEEQSGKSIAQRAKTMTVFLIAFFLFDLLVTLVFSFDHFIRSRQHIRRNRQADLLGGFEIDDESNFRLLHGKIGGLGAFQNLVDVNRGAPDKSAMLTP